MRRTGLCLTISTAIAFAVHTSASYAQSPPNNYCKTVPIRSNSLDWPSKHAWDLFVYLNHPALDKIRGRGLPDCSKPFGTPGTTSVWETWRNAGSEVYLSDGSEPPPWDDLTLPDERPGQTPQDLPKLLANNNSNIISFHGAAAASRKSGVHIMFSPDDGVFDNSGGFGETRMNKSTFEFIRRECLFSRDGQQRYAQAIAAGKKPQIQFPVDAIEVKAAWLDLAKENIGPEKYDSYYIAEYNGKKYGLVALHIITKDLSNWFWASFHHKDAPENKYEIPDTYGAPPAISNTVWNNYRLGGTQTDFTLPTGAASILSDHYVEFGFQRSSCITCHSTATISQQGPMPGGQPKAVCSLTPNLPDFGLDPKKCKTLIGEDAFRTGSDDLLFERGTPDPKWFEKDGKPFYMQTDFVYSIPIRGRPEKAPPPARCLW